ncbi:hypothetical protein Poly24_13780 [Rosistilla carotiformis]|uniref:ASCH domain-containing protein n=1 Tax=Rosistilla carotiformis TaxID=2528017 RepID=A0A518JQ71_9BACT|nr:ASCH domain-containing protein [Rosistilla carotiformis]QDV67676.1 hypothetical protein Poly24_13780 [Rosistilla carotiformis]
MVAYNFQSQFVDASESGTKSHTVRRIIKRRHAREGDRLQLYTGMRTKACRKILDPDPVCLKVQNIVLEVGDESIVAAEIDGTPVNDLAPFASSDGFESLETFHRFWRMFHGVGTFHGKLIAWGAECHE